MVIFGICKKNLYSTSKNPEKIKYAIKIILINIFHIKNKINLKEDKKFLN